MIAATCEFVFVKGIHTFMLADENILTLTDCELHKVFAHSF